MSGQKVNQLKFYWIAFMTGVYTFVYSLKVIIGSFFIKNNRKHVDQAMFDWSCKLLDLVKVTVSVAGRENLPKVGERPIIIMCNHTSLYDIPVAAVALKSSLRMLAKKELFNIPIFSSALRRGEFLSIDRNNRNQAIKDLALAKQKMLSGIVLWVAPEGTRSKDGKLGQFKRGGFYLALESNALIVPFVIKDVYKLQSGTDLTLTIDQTVNVEICDPIDAESYTMETKNELIRCVRERMLNALNDNLDDLDNNNINNKDVNKNDTTY